MKFNHYMAINSFQTQCMGDVSLHNYKAGKQEKHQQ